MNPGIASESLIRPSSLHPILQPSATSVSGDQVLSDSGRQVIDLASGEPSFASPPSATKAAAEALAAGYTHYTPSAGIGQLRKALAEKLTQVNKVVVSDEGVIVTPSAKYALFLAFRAVLDVGDEIIVPYPAWVSFEPMAQIIGARVIRWNLSEDSGFRPEASALEKLVGPRTRAILINSPSNPTGVVFSREELEGIISVAEKHSLAIISDEVYEGVVFGQTEHVSPASIEGAAERTITVGGFSKAFAMTGWRSRWKPGPHPIVEFCRRIQEHTATCASSFGQIGALAALQNRSEVLPMLGTYESNYRALRSGLRAVADVDCPEPQGGFYLFPSVPARIRGARSTQAWLLEEFGILGVSGSAFSPELEHRVRLSFAASETAILEASERLTNNSAGRSSLPSAAD